MGGTHFVKPYPLTAGSAGNAPSRYLPMNLLEKITQGFAAIMAALADLKSNMSAKADASGEVSELKAKVVSQAEQIATFDAQIAAVDKSIAELRDLVKQQREEITSLQADKSRLEAEAKTAGQLASEMLSKEGVKPSTLPEGGASVSDSADLDKLRAQMRVETDPIKRSELAQKARELRGHQGLFGSTKK